MRDAGTMEQAYSDEARQQADKDCQNHKPPVVLAREAIKHAEHRAADLSLFTKNLALWEFISRYAGRAKLIQPRLASAAIPRISPAKLQAATGRRQHFIYRGAMTRVGLPSRKPRMSSTMSG